MYDLNPLLLIDFYKSDHRRQYPEGTELVYSNFTPRKSRVDGVNHMVFFGLQYIIKEYLQHRMQKYFFDRPLEEVLSHYKRRMDNAVGGIPLEHIEELHKLGYLPLHIRALPEGTKVPLQTPAFVMWNTLPEFFWVTNYFETLISNLIWKPCTSATTAWQFRQNFDKYAEETGADKTFVDWQGHDFSFRGMSGVEDACSSGAAHLLFFKGTDTVPAIDFLERYYVAHTDHEIIGGSVSATEHSVMCANGENGEFETLRRLICDVYPKGIVSVVSDTWDLFQLIKEYLPRLKNEILNREGKLVIRPDSGTPHKILNGDPDGISEEDRKGVVRLLGELFGTTTNEKGFKQLHPNIGTIYGDSINLEEQVRILEGLKQNGFESTSVVMGMGSYTYQYVTRDTYGTVCKATYVEVNGRGKPIFKDPKTGGWKKSHKGLLRVNEDLSVTENVDWPQQGGMLETVFKNGALMKAVSLKGIRERLAK